MFVRREWIPLLRASATCDEQPARSILSLLDDAHSTHLFFRMGENLARVQVLKVAVAAVKSGRMTALSKEDVGVRGIVTGDVVRRLVARTIAQLHQYALSTRGGCECIVHPGFCAD